MTESSARFALPFILPGQAQKEVFHNEALAVADALLHAAVESSALTAPPADPAPGQCWLVAAGAAGAWAGRAQTLAAFTSGGWRFIAPVVGMTVWDKAAGVTRRWSGTEWSDGAIAAAALRIGGEQVVDPRVAAVPSPSGGTVIDVEARAAVAALIVALQTHGLID
jgi:hypothetical protein